MTAVTLPRLDIPITGRAAINAEWYRWARDVTARIGGVAAPNLEDLLQAPPVLVVQSTAATGSEFTNEQVPATLPPGSDSVEWQAPAPLPGTGLTVVQGSAGWLQPPTMASEERVEWQAPAPLPGSDATEWQSPPAIPFAEPFDWMRPPVLPTEERVEWLENQIAQLRATIDDLSRLVAGLQQGLDL